MAARRFAATLLGRLFGDSEYGDFNIDGVCWRDDVSSIGVVLVGDANFLFCTERVPVVASRTRVEVCGVAAAMGSLAMAFTGDFEQQGP